jgi:hypothetical protein
MVVAKAAISLSDVNTICNSTQFRMHRRWAGIIRLAVTGLEKLDGSRARVELKSFLVDFFKPHILLYLDGGNGGGYIFGWKFNTMDKPEPQKIY